MTEIKTIKQPRAKANHLNSHNLIQREWFHGVVCCLTACCLSLACSEDGGFSGGGGSKESQKTGPDPRKEKSEDEKDAKESEAPPKKTDEPSVKPEPSAPTAEPSKPEPASEDIATIKATLENLRWNLPCDGNPGAGRLCDSSRVVNDSKVLAGDSKTLFEIKLRFRGIVEPKTYVGGENDGAFWQIGGTPTADAWNVYKLEISSPPQVYYLNRSEALGFVVYRIDYERPVQAYGGATFTITADTQDGIEATNSPAFVFPGLEETPYNGQFIHISVVDIRIK